MDPLLIEGKAAQEEDVEFVLIGAGLPRTGTMSTYTALEVILPGKCHHMARVVSDRSGRNRAHWTKAIKGELTDQEWKEFIRLEKISAGVDYPTSLFWKDLMRIYPNAKVLFTDRDPVKWYQSVTNSILQVAHITEGFWNLPIRVFASAFSNLDMAPYITRAPRRDSFGAKWSGGMFGAVEEGEDAATQFYQEWKEDVLREVPKERLLVWHAKDGWGPLCAFLGVPEPDQPFPNVNDTPSMQKMVRKFKRIRNLFWAVVVGGIAAGTYYYNSQIMDKLAQLTSS